MLYFVSFLLSDEVPKICTYTYKCLMCNNIIPGTKHLDKAGVPGGLVGGPRAYQDQFRGFKSHRVHARGRDFFLRKKMISGKRESVS